MKIRRLILPKANKGDYDSLPEYVKKGLTVRFAEVYADVLKLIF